ncbi:hypothetical protein HYFRA_00010554 [Hymenoscyphus fraxineus]|uniref:Uncharacterized protein n=1 Tax=Hymenoscyphus fraxineus TaxID=746836 RepID=A0A9N9L7R3_9HELO|nr:hypothetical protein HYFRA_00010554 [Hymenoscyphus fraxineus]
MAPRKPVKVTQKEDYFRLRPLGPMSHGKQRGVEEAFAVGRTLAALQYGALLSFVMENGLTLIPDPESHKGRWRMLATRDNGSNLTEEQETCISYIQLVEKSDDELGIREHAPCYEVQM